MELMPTQLAGCTLLFSLWLPRGRIRAFLDTGGGLNVGGNAHAHQ